MKQPSQRLPVSRGPYQLHAEVIPGTGVPVVLMHGFPDNTHLYDRLLPRLAGHRPVVLFDFLGWGQSDKPAGYAYTAANQASDLAAVVGAVDEHFSSLDRRLYAWQVGRFIHDPGLRASLFHSCMSSSCPSGPRSGDLTTT